MTESEQYRPRFFTRNTRVPRPARSTLGKAATAFDYSDILRSSDQKETGLYGRAGAPGRGVDFAADGTSGRRFQRWDDLRYTQRADPQVLGFYGHASDRGADGGPVLRQVTETRSFRAQYTPHQVEIPLVSRRVTPFIESEVDTAVSQAFRQNPYTQPLPRPF